MISLVVPLIVAGVASAAQRPEITLPPTLKLPVVNVANIDACSSVDSQALICLEQFGGSEDDLLNADVDELVGCACCAGSNNLANAYSDCSTYITDNMPSLKTDADAFGPFYPLCSASATCSGSSDDDESSSTSRVRSSTSDETSEEPTETATTSEEEIDPSATNTDIPESITSDILSIPTGCQSMIGAFSSCVRKTPGFSELPYGSQAPCYCCATSDSTVRWTDSVDNWASECADWAVTGESLTIYQVASTFASFCQNFSDACDDITLTTSTAEPTDDSTGDNSDDSSTTEETDNPTETEDEDAAANTNEPGAGAILRVSTVTALAALFALLVVW